MHALVCARVNDAQIVRSKDTQRSSVESPQSKTVAMRAVTKQEIIPSRKSWEKNGSTDSQRAIGFASDWNKQNNFSALIT